LDVSSPLYLPVKKIDQTKRALKATPIKRHISKVLWTVLELGVETIFMISFHGEAYDSPEKKSI